MRLRRWSSVLSRPTGSSAGSLQADRASGLDERLECAPCGSTLPAWLSEMRRCGVTETLPGQTGDVGVVLGLCVLSLRDGQATAMVRKPRG